MTTSFIEHERGVHRARQEQLQRLRVEADELLSNNRNSRRGRASDKARAGGSAVPAHSAAQAAERVRQGSSSSAPVLRIAGGLVDRAGGGSSGVRAPSTGTGPSGVPVARPGAQSSDSAGDRVV